MQHELALLQRDPQPGLDVGTGVHVGLHRGIEEAHRVASAELGPVHRHVGASEGLVDRLVGQLAEEAHADAHRGAMFRVAELETLVQRREDLVAHRRGLLRRLAPLPGQRLQHDDELVATEPGHGVVLAHAAREDRGDLHEQPVALLMADGVVDRLEVVQVDEEQGAHRPVPRAARLCALQPLHQQPPVGQPGEEVEVGQLPHLGLHRLACGDVARRVEQHRPAVHLERERGHLDREHAPVLAAMRRLEGVDFARREQLAHPRA